LQPFAELIKNRFLSMLNFGYNFLNLCYFITHVMKTNILQIIFLFCFTGILSCYAQEKVREPAVAGTFYPADKQSLKTQLIQLFNEVEDKTVDDQIAAIIVPHAGYIFSGQVAASAYAKINPEKEFSRVFVIGTSHHVLLNGASIYNKGDYKTPLGIIPVDVELANRLIDKNQLIKYTPGAHTEEHSIDVQLPFLQYRLKKPFKIVPIVIGTQSTGTCQKLAEILSPYFTPENLFVISSDFSHYPSYKNAVKYDEASGKAVSSNSPATFIQTIVSHEQKNVPGLSTSCCGWSSVLTLLDITSVQPIIQVKHVKYMNSGDSPYGDKVNVVGYHAFVFTRNMASSSTEDFNLTPDDKILLLRIARETIEARLKHRSVPKIVEDKLPENLKINCGAFVTLNKNEQLRGCIGRFMPNQPLYKVVQEMAVSAAFHDTRFTPVVKKEMKIIDIEISVLTPLKKIDSINDFQLGKHGIYIVKGNRSGTYLPQVAESTGWSKEEFLGHCAQDKAGIGWYGWKDANLYTYEAFVFHEEELLSHKK